MVSDRFDPRAVDALLSTHTFGRNLKALRQTGSTNDELKELAGQGAEEGTLVVADEQVAGRGRMGRRWAAPPSTCLLCSILFRPNLLPAQAGWLTMLCSLAAADAVREVAGLEVVLKWPNDLIVEAGTPSAARWRKLAGILTETAVVGERLEFVVVGAGINVNVPVESISDLAPDATSILAETGRRTSREALLAQMLEGIEGRYREMVGGQSPRAEWASRLATLGRQVEAFTGQGRLAGLAQGVAEDGSLLLRTADGTLHHLSAADVTLR